MPTLTPEKPPARKVRSSGESPWGSGLARSGYFLGAVLFHLVLLLVLATKVVFVPPAPVSADFTQTYVPSSAPTPVPPQTSPATLPVPTHALPPLPSVITGGGPAPAFNVPLPELNPTAPLDQNMTKLSAPADHAGNDLASRLPALQATEMKWGRDASNIANSDGDPHQVVAKFPVYLASYSGGDWDCNVHLTDGAIDAGSLPDLVAKINEWSHGKIKGELMPTPLAIGDPDLLAKMPPFIFMTGHKDFVLTLPEIDNLRSYLQNGGAIWGDNALPGGGSRFDVAFHREMKRVIPDLDKNFEDLPLTHEIFTQGWFKIYAVPSGMNYYAEPLQHIDIDGKVAVIYTPNDYSDLYFMRILPGDTRALGPQPLPDSPLFTRRLFLANKTVFFRNFELESSLQAQRLGMNIVGYLLVRFDQELQEAP